MGRINSSLYLTKKREKTQENYQQCKENKVICYIIFMAPINKLQFFRDLAFEFKDKVHSLDSVEEIAVFASVAGGDPYPSDVDIALFVNSLGDLSLIARAKRQAQSKNNGFDVFVFMKDSTFVGNICFRKDCPARSVDCAVKGCGDIPRIQKREGFEYDPKRMFKTPVDVIYQNNPVSILMSWQNELLAQMGLSAPQQYSLRETIYLKCLDCGEEFEFDPGEQKYFEHMGFQQPKRCHDCRDRKNYGLI